MDRSFLSQPSVITASRHFVCVRLATYEDREEGVLLKSLLRTKSGELENSVFVILAADGKTPLVPAARSPKQHFASAAEMAEELARIVKKHPARVAPDDRPPVLPLVANVRLALDVAACDNQPLVLLYGPDEAQRRLATMLAEQAWGPEFVGKFLYARVTDAEEMKRLDQQPRGAGVLVVQPDRFGLKGSVLAQVTAAATKAELAECLRAGAMKHRSPSGTFADHVHAGRQQSIFWETVIPVTDPMEKKAREKR